MDHKFPFNHFLNFKNNSSSSSQVEVNFNNSFLNNKNERLTPSPDLISLNKNISNVKESHSHSEIDDNFQNQTTIEPVSFEENESFDLAKIPIYQQEILSLLKDLIPAQKFNAYFQDLFNLGKISDGKAFFYVSTNFIKTMIENHYLSHIQESVKSVLGNSYQICILVENSVEEKESTNNSIVSSVEMPKSKLILEGLSKKNKKFPSMKDARFHLDLIPSRDDLLNQVNSTVLNHMEDHQNGQLVDYKKTFDNFIVGSSNNMAYASAIAVTKNPGKVYPSLYFHSNSGLGKTHLLNAVANKLREINPYIKICFTTARDFMNEMVNAITNKKVHEFRKKYSEQVDVLLIDDVHDLRNKSGTQNEFFHIFNELYNKGKQLIFTSDKPPKSIDGLEERIKTRLSWGLVLDIQEPDIETRIAILKRKAMEEDIYLSGDVVNLIANSVKGNIRELEGSLIRLGAYASVMQVDIDIEIAKEQLKIAEIQNPHKTTIESIAKSVSNVYKIPVADILSKVRLRDVTKARHVAMYLTHKVLQETLTQIGIFFGKRDHTSVLHAIEKVKNQILLDPEFSQHIQDIESDL